MAGNAGQWSSTRQPTRRVIPDPSTRPIVPLLDRIERYVEVCQTTGCMIWTGAFSKKRNGKRPVIQEGGRGSKVLIVARYMCELRHGPPPSMFHEAGHTCPRGEREDCVNPQHLMWMTRLENECYKETSRAARRAQHS